MNFSIWNIFGPMIYVITALGGRFQIRLGVVKFKCVAFLNILCKLHLYFSCCIYTLHTTSMLMPGYMQIPKSFGMHMINMTTDIVTLQLFKYIVYIDMK